MPSGLLTEAELARVLGVKYQTDRQWQPLPRTREALNKACNLLTHSQPEDGRFPRVNTVNRADTIAAALHYLHVAAFGETEGILLGDEPTFPRQQ